MRYHDVNALTEIDIFSEKLLSVFKYEDSVMTNNDIAVFPLIGKDTVIYTTPPFFRIKLHNKHRNTIVFIEAKLEIDKFFIDTITRKQTFIPTAEIPDVDVVFVDSIHKEFPLRNFRQNVAYGETDDRYFFCLTAIENCSFRMRVRAKTQTGDYLYSNYIYVNYIM